VRPFGRSLFTEIYGFKLKLHLLFYCNGRAIYKSKAISFKNKAILLTVGAFMLVIVVSLANFASFHVLILFWVLAGLGQSFTEVPAQILIAENITLKGQGKVYGCHFAWSHLWWAIDCPLAGFAGINFNPH
jgi:MFS family permease